MANKCLVTITITGEGFSFEKNEGDDYILAYVGKHGELRVSSCKDIKDTDIEKGRPEFVQTPLAIFGPENKWIVEYE